ncbi:hypothetical protein SOV_22100 [Sporomusa ovata DSM 2662]|nr:hypothetical protein [Sporomusa ovata]EQB25527.1 hypothetical protein SOV_4c01890 [Sporomusa ovata DSM 2662]
MPKRVSKIASYIKPNQLRSQSPERSQIDESVIEGMAKIFMQTQANMVNNPKPQTNNSQEVLNLLHQINNKLEGLQGSITSSDAGDQSQQGIPQSGQNQISQQIQPGQNAQANVSSTAESEVSQELKKLFSTLLTTGGQANTSGGNQQAEDASSQKQIQQQQGQNTTQGNNQNSSIAVQTAAQVLSQAQYELSNELEASLQSLKQVISESEKIANKISNLLGEENNQKQ